MQKPATRLRIAVHKFSSCDGCQLAFLNLGEDLLALGERVEISHFAEAGMLDEDRDVDIAFIEGSITTPKDAQRIRNIREHSRYLVTIGACATSGGLQALRNLSHAGEWIQSVYASPEYIETLDRVAAVREHVHVDFELWGCPINRRQLTQLINSMALGALPRIENDKLCLQCKRQLLPCVVVTRGIACLGPLTRTGCGALCPSFGRECYGCYGPAENANVHALGNRLEGLGLTSAQIRQRLLSFYSNETLYTDAAREWDQKP